MGTGAHQPIQIIHLNAFLFPRLVVRSVVVVGSATIGAVLSPILITAGLGAIGFGVAGPVAGKFLSSSYQL
jgi:hypothetical protein